MSTLAELVLIAVGSAIVNNVVLSQFLGICPFLGVSKKTETAAGMGGAVIFVITISSFITGLIYKFILANPFLVKKGIDLTYLKTIVFILVIAALVQFVEMFLKKSMPSLYQSLGVYLPLINHKLCGTWCSLKLCYLRLQSLRGCCLRIFHSIWFLYRNRIDGGNP